MSVRYKGKFSCMVKIGFNFDPESSNIKPFEEIKKNINNKMETYLQKLIASELCYENDVTVEVKKILSYLYKKNS